jgi:hypothetical protein
MVTVCVSAGCNGDTMLNNNVFQVVAMVDSWDLPPLSERYSQACKALKTGKDAVNVKVTCMCGILIDTFEKGKNGGVVCPSFI